MPLSEFLRRQPQSRGGAGRQVGDECVSTIEQLVQDRNTFVGLEVQGDGLLAPVGPDEVGRLAEHHVVVVAGEVAALGIFDLDHAGAEVGEHARAHRRGHRLLHRDDGDPGQRQRRRFGHTLT